jgi:hypothetical protein
MRVRTHPQFASAAYVAPSVPEKTCFAGALLSSATLLGIVFWAVLSAGPMLGPLELVLRGVAVPGVLLGLAVWLRHRRLKRMRERADFLMHMGETSRA